MDEEALITFLTNSHNSYKMCTALVASYEFHVQGEKALMAESNVMNGKVSSVGYTSIAMKDPKLYTYSLIF